LAGTASYDSWKLVGLAVTSLVTHSFFPLRVVGYLGVAIAAISGPLGLYILVTKFFMGNPNSFTGPAVLAVIIVFLIGIVLACLGLIALYIETISVEVSGRPLYVVRKKNME
jgi:hypothetical protein